MTDYIFSIVTVCRNSENTICDTMYSVSAADQNCPVEYVIVDGASTDHTLQYIKKFALSHQDDSYIDINWLSEPDNGIYDAMNKAVTYCHGKYILFINSGDIMEHDALNDVLKYASSELSDDILYGDVNSVYKYGDDKLVINRKAVDTVTDKTLQNGMGLSHQSMFTKRDIFTELGGFRTEFRIGADWDFLIRSYAANKSIRHIPVTIASITKDGLSSRRHNQERHAVRRANKMYQLVDWGYVRDVLDPGNIVAHLVGQDQFLKYQLKYNRWKMHKSVPPIE